MSLADTYAESARKASNGNWRKPRMKIYDYNEEFGGNYYQPMMAYINEREAQGPFHQRRAVNMPDRAEVVSHKYSQMRHEDNRPVDMELEDFLGKAYKKQIREINGSTATAHRLMAHNSKDTTYKSGPALMGYHLECDNDRHHYTRELSVMNQKDYIRREKEARIEARKAWEAEQRQAWVDTYLKWGPGGPPPEPLSQEEIDRVKDVRAKLYWIYRPRNPRECQQWLE